MKHSSPTRRAQTITRHLTAAQSQSSSTSNEEKKQIIRLASTVSADSSEKDKGLFRKIIGKVPNDINFLNYNIAEHLPGPLHDKERYPNGWADVFLDLRTSSSRGENHVKYAEYQQRYGGKAGLSSNIVVPFILMSREGPNNSGGHRLPVITQQVIIGNPEDARRIARMHIPKTPNFTTLLFNSIISTTDYNEWQRQREHLVGAFLPKASLEKIFPVTLERAKQCPSRLEGIMNEHPDKHINISEFMLYETEAQLQLALFGMDEDWMNETNLKFREAMSGRHPPTYVRSFLNELIGNMKAKNVSGPVSSGLDSDARVQGPLSDALKTLEFEGKADVGNALIFAFAGHDTTGHTLTWLIFELAKNMQLQKRLQDEIDGFFEELNGRDMTYQDLSSLSFMTKCITETLRLWPAVANGTFREIQFDDTISGPEGEMVKIPKGTYVQLVNWSRHRNPDLWGDDVDTFNPDREWKDNELWNNDVFRAYNPASERFSPFTFAPRDCIGKNFAHMEMRAILCYLLKNYTFELTDAAAAFDSSQFLGVNYGTMGPRDITQPEWVQTSPGAVPDKRAPIGLSVRPIPRK